jgi:hypothetical protein
LKTVKPRVSAAQAAVAEANPLDNFAAAFFVWHCGDAGCFGCGHGLGLPDPGGAKSELLFNFVSGA